MSSEEIWCKYARPLCEATHQLAACSVGSTYIAMGIDLVPLSAGISRGGISIHAEGRNDPFVPRKEVPHLNTGPAVPFGQAGL